MPFIMSMIILVLLLSIFINYKYENREWQKRMKSNGDRYDQLWKEPHTKGWRK